MSKIIAIDGPAGSGKGTLAKALSKKYNLVKNKFEKNMLHIS